MATPISRRTLLVAGGGAAAGLTLPGVAAHAGVHPTTVRFRLDAVVLDGGEQVTSITLDTARLGPIDPASLTTGTFSVHARATSPIPSRPASPSSASTTWTARSPRSGSTAAATSCSSSATPRARSAAAPSATS